MLGERCLILKIVVGFVGIILNSECGFQEPDSFACHPLIQHMLGSLELKTRFPIAKAQSWRMFDVIGS